MHRIAAIEGPAIETRRVELKDRNAYVELRQVMHGESAQYHAYAGYDIEYGSLEFGHIGTWGRDNWREAWECYMEAITHVVETFSEIY